MEFLSLKLDFVIANSEYPDENAAFHLGMYCLPKYPCRVSRLQRVNDELRFLIH